MEPTFETTKFFPISFLPFTSNTKENRRDRGLGELLCKLFFDPAADSLLFVNYIWDTEEYHV